MGFIKNEGKKTNQFYKLILCQHPINEKATVSTKLTKASCVSSNLSRGFGETHSSPPKEFITKPSIHLYNHKGKDEL